MVTNKILSILNGIVPKTNIILFNSFPPFSDNSRELYSYIVANRRDVIEKYRLYWGQENRNERPDWVEPGTKTIVKKSLRGIWVYLRAKYIFSTHGYFLGVHSGKGQLQVNLWHGMGYKCIKAEEQVYRGDKTIATSELYRKIQADALGFDKQNVLVTGLPRNDKLFFSFDALKKLGIDREQYSRIYIWLPTYRAGGHSDGHIDGASNSLTPNGLSRDNYEQLNNFLKESGYCLIIKLHPIEERVFDFKLSYSNIVFLRGEDLKCNNLDLYCILQETDALISDYSSVIVDYLILDKPIAVFVSDFKEYKSNRGFVFDRIDDYLPGPIITSMDEFIGFLEKTDYYKETFETKRKTLRDLFHQYQDNCSSERICNKLFGNIGEVNR